MSWLDTIRAKLADEDFRRNLKRGFVAVVVVGASAYVYSKGRKHGYARRLTEERKEQEAYALEEHES